MKIGAENRNKLIAAVALSVVALILVGKFLFQTMGSSGPAPAATTAQVASAPAVARTTRVVTRKGTVLRKVDPTPHSLDPTLRYDWLKASEDTKYEGNGRNIFMAQAEPPPTPEASGATDAADEAEQGPPQPPPPPPINLKFFGFASKPGEPKKIFLSQGEDVFIAAEGEIVDRRYRILRINPGAVEIEDVLNNNRQSIPLTQG